MDNVAIVGLRPNLAMPPLRTINLTALRMGAQTTPPKVAYLWDSIDTKRSLLHFTFRDGVHAANTVVASAIDGVRVVMLYDAAPPAMATLQILNVSEDIAITLDMSDGSGGGGGEAGDPATVKAVVRVDGASSARDLVAVERRLDGSWRVAGRLRTADGQIDLRVTDGDVYVVAVDDFGAAFQAGLNVVVGQTVRPSVYTGWLYRITEDGALPEIEPEWWPAEGDNASRPLGTARAIAVRYYQPLAAGPLPVEVL